jgi:Collagen triple helix repeat (20 copies).
MQRLRHPVRAIREPFGKAGLTVAILALVLAMVGGAWAAAGLNSKQKKEVTKIAKKYAGKPGAAGTNGTNGTNGASGAKGDKGDKGDPGNAGGTGPSGKSVVTGTEATGTANCEGQGGSWVEVEGSGTKKFACNGTTGFTNTLPPEETETGTFLASEIAEEAVQATISFNIPLAAKQCEVSLGVFKAAGLCANQVHYAPVSIQEGKIGGLAGEYCAGETGTELAECEARATAIRSACGGTAETPEAEEGNLCIYESPLSIPVGGFENALIVKLGEFNGGFGRPGAGTTGALISFLEPSAGARFFGTWAVTAA